ncbi:MAG: hypothetical protein Q4B09_11380, partial [Lachnospiraceae bacterium]|nr:hypothetical protein [Lachnospiraceae bacterium]
MALQIYGGTSAASRTTALLNEMIRRSMAEPERRFFVVAPEQSTMETQKKLVSLHPRKCILNLEVTSLNRLAYRVFAETGFRTEDILEEIGKTFLLEKIALEQKQKLPYLGRNLARPEFLAEMKSLLSELMLYDVTPELLEPILRKQGAVSEADPANAAAAEGSGQCDAGRAAEVQETGEAAAFSGQLRAKLSDILTV